MIEDASNASARRALRRRLRQRHRVSPVPELAARRAYDRRTELPRVLPLWPHELDDLSPEARRRILGKLRGALRAERRRGVAGHWTYDLARHIELLRVYRLEMASSDAPVFPEAETQSRLSGISIGESDSARSRFGALLAFRWHRSDRDDG